MKENMNIHNYFSVAAMIGNYDLFHMIAFQNVHHDSNSLFLNKCFASYSRKYVQYVCTFEMEPFDHYLTTTQLSIQSINIKCGNLYFVLISM